MVGLEALLEQALQVCIETRLGRELHRMVAAFALGEVAIEHMDRLAVAVGEGAADPAPLGFLVIAGEPLEHFQRLRQGHQRNAVMTFLPVKMHVVTQRLDFGEGELVVGDLGFLQANDVRAMFFDQCRQLVRTCAQAVDIEGNDFHRGTPEKTPMLAHPAPRQPALAARPWRC